MEGLINCKAGPKARSQWAGDAGSTLPLLVREKPSHTLSFSLSWEGWLESVCWEGTCRWSRLSNPLYQEEGQVWGQGHECTKPVFTFISHWCESSVHFLLLNSFKCTVVLTILSLSTFFFFKRQFGDHTGKDGHDWLQIFRPRIIYKKPSWHNPYIMHFIASFCKLIIQRSTSDGQNICMDCLFNRTIYFFMHLFLQLLICQCVPSLTIQRPFQS